jgi:uncharacterized membrane protein
MNPRLVKAFNGWHWITAAFHLFAKAPLAWIAITVILAVIWLLSFVIPLLGAIVVNLLSMVLLAGILMACVAAERGERVHPGYLLLGFSLNLRSLIIVGAVYLAGQLLITAVVWINLDPKVLELIKPGVVPGPETARTVIDAMRVPLLIAMVLYTPLLMAIWFAPALIIFENLPAIDAMRQSFKACMINTLPMLVYGLALFALLSIATIPFFLGLLVLVPVALCSIYTSYMDIFRDQPPRPEKPASA